MNQEKTVDQKWDELFAEINEQREDQFNEWKELIRDYSSMIGKLTDQLIKIDIDQLDENNKLQVRRMLRTVQFHMNKLTSKNKS